MSLLGNVLSYGQHLLQLVQRTERNSDDISQLQSELHELTLVVRDLQQQMGHNAEGERHEREKLLLRLKNQLLRFEMRLPPARPE